MMCVLTSPDWRDDLSAAWEAQRNGNLPRRFPRTCWRTCGVWFGAAWSPLISSSGAPVRSVKTAFNNAVRLAGLWGRVTPHALRHTTATWLMRRGVPIWQATRFLGMSAETLE
jgi:integrase